MTHLQSALADLTSTELDAIARVACEARDRNVSERRTRWGTFWNALLCEINDAQLEQQRAWREAKRARIIPGSRIDEPAVGYPDGR